LHTGLKPSHLPAGPSGDVKVLDFGIAKALAKTTQVTTNNGGTSAYASPERLEHGHVNEHVDFWSLGVILYEAIAGHRPYPALDRNRGQLEHAIRTNAPREPLPPSCPPELAAIVSKLLAYQVERRYPSAAAIRSDLELFLAGKKPAATSEYTTPATMPIGQATARRATEPLVTVVPPTDPLPAPQPAAASVAAPPPVAPAALALRRIDLFRRALWMVVLLTLVGLVTTEGVAWVAAERFREGIDGLERNTIVEKQADYDGIRASSMLGAGLKLRVNGPLKDRLIVLADSVITDYRREEPTMPPGEWKQAQQSLRWAAQLA